MPQLTLLLDEIQKRLQELGQPERVAFINSNAPSQMQQYGTVADDQISVCSHILSVLRAQDPKEIIQFAQMLVDTQVFDCQSVAYRLFSSQPALLQSLSLPQFYALAGIQDNWASVDSYGVILAGGLWRLGVLPDKRVLDWVKSDDVWTRRRALVATVGLNMQSHGATGDADRTLMVCKFLVHDDEPMVNKAMSWALRELAKVLPGDVEKFMKAYNKCLSQKVRTEVRNKLETGRKAG